MKKLVSIFAVAALALVIGGARPAAAQDLQQKLAAAKQAAAKNQQVLRSYTWLEKTELSYKGEVKATKVDSCRYGPDGKVQKTPVVEPPPPEKKRGLRGKIVAKKTDEMKTELESAVALVQQYVPPDPGLMQIVMNNGAASLAQAGPGFVALKFPGYVKTGRRADAHVRICRQKPAPDRHRHLARRAVEHSHAAGHHGGAARRHELPWPGRPEHSEQQYRGPDRALELSKGCSVGARSPCVSGRAYRGR